MVRAQTALSIVLLAASLVAISSAQLQCPLFTVANLGSTTTITADEGLLPLAVRPPGESSTRIPVRVLDYNIVCDASGSRRNTSSFISVVVQFVCMISSSSPTLQDCDGTTNIIRQYQFRCGSANNWEVTTIGDAETLMPEATLSTETQNRCVSCVDDEQSFIDQVTHCSDCPSNINCNQGQRRCYQGEFVDMCCNYYNDNVCVATCPSPFVGDMETFDCGCGQLSLDNGTVDYTSRFVVGSVATYTCNTGFRLVGNVSRTCTNTGWDGEDISCEFIQCPVLTDIENGAVSINSMNRSLGSIATYTCVSGYALLGNSQRTCQMDSSWDDTDPRCELAQCPPLADIENGEVSTDLSLGSIATYTCDSGYVLTGESQRNCQMDGSWDGMDPKCNLHPGVIAGIVIAGLVLIVLVTTTLIIIAIIVCKKNERPEE